MAFCPKCGKRGIKGKFCSNCAPEEQDISFKDIKITHCVECDKYLIQNKWKKFESPDSAVIKTALQKIKNPNLKKIEIIPDFEAQYNKPGLEQEIELGVIIEEEEFKIPAILFHTYCPICSKKGTQYLEGVLQLRNATPEVIKFVRDDLKKHKDTVFIVKENVRGKTADFILTSSKYLRAIGRKLNQRFNGELTETAKLFSFNHETSKDIYRINVLFKMRHFKVGDIVTDSRGRRVKVKTLGKKVSGIDIDTGKKVFVD